MNQKQDRNGYDYCLTYGDEFLNKLTSNLSRYKFPLVQLNICRVARLFFRSKNEKLILYSESDELYSDSESDESYDEQYFDCKLARTTSCLRFYVFTRECSRFRETPSFMLF